MLLKDPLFDNDNNRQIQLIKHQYNLYDLT